MGFFGTFIDDNYESYLMRTLCAIILLQILSTTAFPQSIVSTSTIQSSEIGLSCGIVFPKYVTNNVKYAKGSNGNSVAFDINYYIKTRRKHVYVSIGMRTSFYRFKTDEIQVVGSVNNTFIDMAYNVTYNILCVGTPIRLNVIQPLTKNVSLQCGVGFYPCIQTRPDKEDQLPIKGYAECYGGIITKKKISTTISISKPIRAFLYDTFIAGYSILNCSIDVRYCIGSRNKVL